MMRPCEFCGNQHARESLDRHGNERQLCWRCREIEVDRRLGLLGAPEAAMVRAGDLWLAEDANS